MKKTKEEIDDMPTILDVIEQLAKEENANIPPLDYIFPGRKYYEEGNYIPVRHGGITNYEVIMMPSSQAGLRLYRGQNKEFKPSFPSIFRSDYANPAKTAIARLKSMEFKLLISGHPVIKELNQMGFRTNYDAICQHYGFPTNMLDMTNNKWVAAFMAITSWDKRTGKYTPVDKDFEDGYGVIYVSDNVNDLYNRGKLFPIGYQFFKRPSLQSCFGLKMEAGEDFSALEGFRAIYFRHDLAASKCVFAMAYNQNRFSPDDYIATLANAIYESNSISISALETTAAVYYNEMGTDYLSTICSENNIEIVNSPVIHYDKTILTDELAFWQNGGFERLRSNITKFWPITRIRLTGD